MLNDRVMENVVFIYSYQLLLLLHDQVDKLPVYIFIEKNEDRATYIVSINRAACTKWDDESPPDYIRYACVLED